MDKIMVFTMKYNLFIVEDDSYYTGKDGIKKALGSYWPSCCFFIP